MRESLLSKNEAVRPLGMVRAWLTAWALAVFCAARPASAAELLLAQPSACAIGDELVFRAERALGRPLSEAGPLRCTIHIVHDQGALAARLELESAGQPSRLRSFRAPTCEKLTDTLALAVVLALGASAEEESAANADTPAAASASGPAGDATSSPAVNARDSVAPPHPTPTPVDGPGAPSNTGSSSTDTSALGSEAAVSAASSASGDDEAVHASLRAALLFDAGTLPAIAVGPALDAALGDDRLELRASASYLPAREASIEVSDGATAGAQIGLLAGALLACAPRLMRLLPAANLRLGACAGAELGFLSGSGVGVNAPKQRGALWSAARVDLAGRYGLGPHGLGIEVAFSALVPIERHEFRVAEEPVHRPGAAVARASVGLGLELD